MADLKVVSPQPQQHRRQSATLILSSAHPQTLLPSKKTPVLSHRKGQPVQMKPPNTPNLLLTSNQMSLAIDPRRFLSKMTQKDNGSFSVEAATAALARVVATRVLEKVNLDQLPSILQSQTSSLRNSNRSLTNETERATKVRRENGKINMDLVEFDSPKRRLARNQRQTPLTSVHQPLDVGLVSRGIELYPSAQRHKSTGPRERGDRSFKSKLHSKIKEALEELHMEHMSLLRNQELLKLSQASNENAQQRVNSQGPSAQELIGSDVATVAENKSKFMSSHGAKYPIKLTVKQPQSPDPELLMGPPTAKSSNMAANVSPVNVVHKPGPKHLDVGRIELQNIIESLSYRQSAGSQRSSSRRPRPQWKKDQKTRITDLASSLVVTKIAASPETRAKETLQCETPQAGKIKSTIYFTRGGEQAGLRFSNRQSSVDSRTPVGIHSSRTPSRDIQLASVYKQSGLELIPLDENVKVTTIGENSKEHQPSVKDSVIGQFINRVNSQRGSVDSSATAGLNTTKVSPILQMPNEDDEGQLDDVSPVPDSGVSTPLDDNHDGLQSRDLTSWNKRAESTQPVAESKQHNQESDQMADDTSPVEGHLASSLSKRGPIIEDPSVDARANEIVLEVITRSGSANQNTQEANKASKTEIAENAGDEMKSPVRKVEIQQESTSGINRSESPPSKLASGVSSAADNNLFGVIDYAGKILLIEQTASDLVALAKARQSRTAVQYVVTSSSRKVRGLFKGFNAAPSPKRQRQSQLAADLNSALQQRKLAGTDWRQKTPASINQKPPSRDGTNQQPPENAKEESKVSRKFNSEEAEAASSKDDNPRQLQLSQNIFKLHKEREARQSPHFGEIPKLHTEKIALKRPSCHTSQAARVLTQVNEMSSKDSYQQPPKDHAKSSISFCAPRKDLKAEITSSKDYGLHPEKVEVKQPKNVIKLVKNKPLGPDGRPSITQRSSGSQETYKVEVHSFMQQQTPSLQKDEVISPRRFETADYSNRDDLNQGHTIKSQNGDRDIPAGGIKIVSNQRVQMRLVKEEREITVKESESQINLKNDSTSILKAYNEHLISPPFGGDSNTDSKLKFANSMLSHISDQDQQEQIRLAHAGTGLSESVKYFERPVDAELDESNFPLLSDAIMQQKYANQSLISTFRRDNTATGCGSRPSEKVKMHQSQIRQQAQISSKSNRFTNHSRVTPPDSSVYSSFNNTIVDAKDGGFQVSGQGVRIMHAAKAARLQKKMQMADLVFMYHQQKAEDEAIDSHRFESECKQHSSLDPVQFELQHDRPATQKTDEPMAAYDEQSIERARADEVRKTPPLPIPLSWEVCNDSDDQANTLRQAFAFQPAQQTFDVRLTKTQELPAEGINIAKPQNSARVANLLSISADDKIDGGSALQTTSPLRPTGTPAGFTDVVGPRSPGSSRLGQSKAAGTQVNSGDVEKVLFKRQLEEKNLYQELVSQDLLNSYTRGAESRQLPSYSQTKNMRVISGPYENMTFESQDAVAFKEQTHTAPSIVMDLNVEPDYSPANILSGPAGNMSNRRTSAKTEAVNEVVTVHGSKQDLPPMQQSVMNSQSIIGVKSNTAAKYQESGGAQSSRFESASLRTKISNSNAQYVKSVMHKRLYSQMVITDDMMVNDKDRLPSVRKQNEATIRGDYEIVKPDGRKTAVKTSSRLHRRTTTNWMASRPTVASAYQSTQSVIKNEKSPRTQSVQSQWRSRSTLQKENRQTSLVVQDGRLVRGSKIVQPCPQRRGSVTSLMRNRRNEMVPEEGAHSSQKTYGACQRITVDLVPKLNGEQQVGAGLFGKISSQLSYALRFSQHQKDLDPSENFNRMAQAILKRKKQQSSLM